MSKENVDIDSVTISDFRYDICREFDCCEDFMAQQNISCGGRFWCDNCLFYSEHLKLNKEQK